jgi:membrane protease YdiL (CAAX protease family)
MVRGRILHGDPGVSAADGTAGRRIVRAEDVRALIAILIVLGGTISIIFWSGPLVDRFFSPAWLDVPMRVLMILMALAGAVLLRQPMTAGARPASLVLTALPVGCFGVAAAIALEWLGGFVAPGAAGGVAAAGPFLLGSLIFLVRVGSEEVLLRGLLQPVLARAWGPAAGIMVSAGVFTLIHVAGGWRDPVSLTNITLAGIWFGLLAYRTGGILAPTLAHFGWNWTEEMLFGATPNPGIGAFGSAIDVDLVGPAIWGGSVDGLNASLVTCLVLALIILPLVWRGKARR